MNILPTTIRAELLILTSIDASNGSYSWAVPNTVSTQCKVKISDSNNLNNYDISDNFFSIIPTLTVTSPNGGEQWCVGSIKNILWQNQNISTINIEYTTNNGTIWLPIARSIDASNGSYSWAVPNTVSTQCKVKISDSNNLNNYDISDNFFSIIPSLTIISPNGGEQWSIESSIKNITWQNQNISTINIEYTTNNGATWLPIATTISASIGSYSWIVPNTISTQCKIKIADSGNLNNFDLSNQTFSIIPTPTINIFMPYFGVQWDVGLIKNINYSQQSIQYVKIEYSTNSGADWQLIINNYPSSGSYSWLVPNTPSKFCKIKITDETNQNVFDISDSTFEILAVNWFPQNSYVYSTLKDISFLDFNNGFICGPEW